MKLKLDENLGRVAWQLLERAGHDVATVHGQGLSGATDNDLAGIVRSEGRCLVTLDLDFANPLLFRPSDYAGIAVLRLPAKVSDAEMQNACRMLIAGLANDEIAGRLWIVEMGRIRQYQPESGTEDE